MGVKDDFSYPYPRIDFSKPENNLPSMNTISKPHSFPEIRGSAGKFGASSNFTFKPYARGIILHHYQSIITLFNIKTTIDIA